MSKIAIPTFPLRLPKTTRVEATEIATNEGISLNQFIALAVAEKIVRLRRESQDPYRKPHTSTLSRMVTRQFQQE
jgi:HicB family